MWIASDFDRLDCWSSRGQTLDLVKKKNPQRWEKNEKNLRRPETSCLHLHRTSNSRPSGPHLPTNNYTLSHSPTPTSKIKKRKRKRKGKKGGETPPPTRSLRPLSSPHHLTAGFAPKTLAARAGSRLPAGPAAPCPSAPDSCLGPTLPLPPRSAPSRPPPHPPPRPPLPRRRS